jgi:hypothetical protein
MTIALSRDLNFKQFISFEENISFEITTSKEVVQVQKFEFFQIIQKKFYKTDQRGL